MYCVSVVGGTNWRMTMPELESTLREVMLWVVRMPAIGLALTMLFLALVALSNFLDNRR